ncbi:MAG: sugar-binding transcriptional regulator [Bacillota bacterium]
MDPILQAQVHLLPELTSLLKKRYSVLELIQTEQPVGRRTLSELTGAAEREIRKETDLLRDQALIKMSKSGMVLTDLGVQVIGQLQELVKELSGAAVLEAELEKRLGIKQAVVLPGDSDRLSSVKAAIGRQAARLVEDMFESYQTIAVTGGSTMAAVAAEIRAVKVNPAMQFVAARGGLGEEMLHQANTIASSFAEKTGGAVRTLYLPEHLSAEALEMMMKEPVIKEMMELYDQTDLVIHGIGDAEEMAIRRRSSVKEVEKIKSGGAVSEAFGYYFDKSGKIVYRIPTAGIQLEQVQRAPSIMAVAGGRTKARAIESYFQAAPDRTILVTDEGAARAILNPTTKLEEL